MASLVDEPDYSIFDNKNGLSEDMKFLACMPELCDVTFLVGETREPVCAVKAVLAARSRVFHKMLCSQNQPPVNPSSKGKKDSAKEPKLKLFLKRSSEPSLVVPGGQIQLQAHQTLVVDEFEPDVFRQLIEYIHTGCVTLQARTLLGVMNAADYYGLEELRRACLGFVQCCINVDTVCALLASAEKYIQYKCTKSLVQKMRHVALREIHFEHPVIVCGQSVSGTWTRGSSRGMWSFSNSVKALFNTVHWEGVSSMSE